MLTRWRGEGNVGRLGLVCMLFILIMGHLSNRYRASDILWISDLVLVFSCRHQFLHEAWRVLPPCVIPHAPSRAWVCYTDDLRSVGTGTKKWGCPPVLCGDIGYVAVIIWYKVGTRGSQRDWIRYVRCKRSVSCPITFLP